MPFAAKPNEFVDSGKRHGVNTPDVMGEVKKRKKKRKRIIITFEVSQIVTP
jgi:hypothetical protein